MSNSVSWGSLRALPSKAFAAETSRQQARHALLKATRTQTGALPRALGRRLATLTLRLGLGSEAASPKYRAKLNRELEKLANDITALPNFHLLFPSTSLETPSGA